MTRPTKETIAGRVYLELRKKAKSERRSTDEFLQLHALEAFVDRLATSVHAEDFVLKGGVLLSAYDVRRPTRDVDLSSHNVPNAPAQVETIVDAIARTPRSDGWELQAVSSESIREDASYSGVRVTVRGSLASARQEFHVDVSIGDPIVPPPRSVSLERLLGGSISLQGYPLEMVVAEKLVTALQRGTTNTRWRDYADMFLLSRLHRIDADTLLTSVEHVLTARGAVLRTLTAATEGYGSAAQAKWSAWTRKQKLDDRLPRMFRELLENIAKFADPLLEKRMSGQKWDPSSTSWRVE